MNQQPLNGSEIRDLARTIAEKLKNPETTEEDLKQVIETAVASALIRNELENYILLPKHKGL